VDINIEATLELEDVHNGKSLIASYRLPNGRQESVNIDIPPGVEHNNMIRFSGLGADTITVSAHVNDAAATSGITFTVGGGDSTVAAFDNITGFRIGDHQAGTISKASDTLDFATVSLATYTATAATGFTSAELTVAVAGATGCAIESDAAICVVSFETACASSVL
jgi:hypothetical protein